MLPDRASRRLFCAGCAAGLAAFAGCSGGDAGGSSAADPTDDTSAGTGTSTGTAGRSGTATDAGAGTATGPEAATATGTATGTASGSDLDLREANVTGVAVERVDGGHRFDVTLLHDDDGEDGYANWWQVERPDGTRLGRRELLHAHGTRLFTRSATVQVPAGVTCVVVRGHDRTHGYGGQAALATLDGDVEFVPQGPEPRPFAGRDC